MATTTPNNGWTVPTSTDYVKDGATAIETLGDAIDASVGTGLLAWQSWAPTLSSGWANGNGTWEAYYCQIGKTVHVEARFTLGSTTTKGTNMECSLPVNAARVIRQPSTAIAFITSIYPMVVNIISADKIVLYGINAGGAYANASTVTTAVPATWATGSSLHFAFTYEAA